MAPVSPARVCLNGHGTAYYEKFCGECGEETIADCPNCNAHIRGVGLIGPRALLSWTAPKYCTDCGQPFPWTAAKLKAVRELADEVEGLSDQDREVLKKDLGEIGMDTPSAEVGSVRIKRILGKLRGPSAELLWKATADIASTMAKKILLGD